MPVPDAGQSSIRSVPRNPMLTVEPEQPSGMKVIAACGLSIASASAARI
jgi:hypothetical protein